MNIEKKIKSFASLGKSILKIIENKDDVINLACSRNPWFIPEFIHKAIYGISYMLKVEKLEKWI